MQNKINIKNKRAYFDYEIIEKFTAGIVLTGTEVKSIREGKVSLGDAYCFIRENEMYVRGMQIAEYKFGTYNNHSPERERKLLLRRKEIKRLSRKTKESGNTIISIQLFFSETGYAKLQIGLATGKKQYDKRESIKQNDAKRQIDRMHKFKVR
ncbi:MAG: SsrA-binding protein SmpB [Bacteroidales bacterium]|nr:SsrA-binding protein SmpB [Bacteroidales bacterium]